MTWRPGPLLTPLLIAAAAPALVAPWFPLAVPLAATLVLLLIAAACAEAAMIRRLRPRAELAATPILSLAEPERIVWHLSHPGSLPLSVRLRARLPPSLGGGSAAVTLRVPAGRTLEAAIDVHPGRRGCEPLEAPWTSWTAWGLMERTASAGGGGEVTVLPNLRAVGRMQRRLDALFLAGMGARMAPRPGGGREFSRLREYVSGDDIRTINWKASARRDHLVVQEFRIERAQDVMLVIDRSHAMAARSGGLAWCDRAVDAALRLAAYAGRFEDRVGACSFGHDVAAGPPPGRGGGQAQLITAFLGQLQPEAEPADWKALAADLRRRLRNRTLVVIFSTVAQHGAHRELVLALRTLAARHLPLLISYTDPALAARAGTLPEDRAGLAQAVVATDLIDGRTAIARQLRESGVLVVDIAPEDSTEAAINGYIDVKRRQLL